ncbi:MAG: DUF4130 domain-containing protein [Variovorax sp.]|nr:DUF4130 domain-containing protein [Variovorax sp.]
MPDLYRQPHAGQMDPDEKPPSGVNLVLPRSFLSLCSMVILHHDPARFALLYRLLWRLVHEPALHRDPHDDDRLRALHMARAVRRDIQKMKSQVRFVTIRQTADGEPLQIAWFAPDHYIVEAVAPFFMRRMAHARWAVLTPESCVRGRGESLEFGPGARCERRLDRDAAESEWLGCYHQVFGDEPSRSPLRSDKDSEPAQSFRPDSVP